ncbi:hypothetical protein Gpo141_00007067 [Globisporangium polare]
MFGFNVNKLKPNLKMAVHRIGIVKNKKANAAVAVRREIATLLEDSKEEKARIRVEGIIRDDFTVEGYEILELLCELVAERANLVKTERECPYDMREAVCTLIWAANRTEIPELIEVKKQLVKKYGQDFAAAASRNVDGCVNERVIQKLSVQPPSAYLVVNYMKEIAAQFKVDWEPDEQAIVDPLAPIPAPTGMSVASASVSGPSFVQLYAMPAPPPAMPAAPTEKPVDSSAFRVPPASASSRMFSPPPAAPGGNHYTPPPPPTSYVTQPPQQQQKQQQQYQQQHDSGYGQPPPQQQQNSHHQQNHHHHQSQSSSYVGPHAAAPTPPPPAAQPRNDLNDTQVSTSSDSSIPDFDELTARFERLRKRQDESETSFTF